MDCSCFTDALLWIALVLLMQSCGVDQFFWYMAVDFPDCASLLLIVPVLVRLGSGFFWVLRTVGIRGGLYRNIC